jgi:thiol-disulfide isomerase/thioredoxin
MPLSSSSLTRRRALLTFGAALATTTVSAIDTREAAPKFKAKTLDGESLNNDSVRGKVVLLEFWATWCPYCRRDEPALQELVEDYEGNGLLLVGVDVAESRKTVKRYLESHPHAGKTVMMEDTNLAAAFAAKAFPYYVLIDREGYVVGEQRGSGGAASLRKLLKRAGLDSSRDDDGADELQASPRRN